MNYAVIYARVSSKDQEIEGFSIPAQIKTLQEYASKNHFIIVQQFTDTETAKKAGRTHFNAMLKFLENNKHIKHILVEKTDRLLRNMTDYETIEKLAQSNITIHLVKEGSLLGKDSRANEKFVFGIKALMAKNFADNLSEEVKKGMLEKASQGIYPTVAPYGYLNVRENGKSIIQIDPIAAAYVRKMFELYATGSYSLKTLRKKMLEDGMVYRNGKNFYKSVVEGILKNEFYTGIFHYRGKRYENASHEPIISKELYQQVQTTMTNPFKSKSRKGLFGYTNFIKCGVCGCALTAELKKEKYIYYHCTGYKGNCKQPYIRQEELEAQFELLLKDFHIPEDLQQEVLAGVRSSFKDKIEYQNSLVEQLQNQIKLLQKRIDHAYLDKVDGKISEEFWKTHTKNWNEEKERLMIKLMALQKADTHYVENANIILELVRNASQAFHKQNLEQKRKLINLLVSNCTYKDGILDIELKPVFEDILEISKTGNWCARKDSNLRPTD